jgi:hypothetical protein
MRKIHSTIDADPTTFSLMQDTQGSNRQTINILNIMRCEVNYPNIIHTAGEREMTFPESLIPLAEIIVAWWIGGFVGFAAGRYKHKE